MTIKIEQLLEIAGKVLGLLGVKTYDDLQITSAHKMLDEWRVNFSFVKSMNIYKTIGCFSVNANSGEITGMWLERSWK